MFCSAYRRFLTKLNEGVESNFCKIPANNWIYHFGESHCLSYANQCVKITGSEHKIIPKIVFGAKAFHFSRKINNKFKAITEAILENLPKSSNVFCLLAR